MMPMLRPKWKLVGGFLKIERHSSFSVAGPAVLVATDLEVQKIAARIETVSNTLTDSELELGALVRLSVELPELEACIRGIRFASGQAPPWQ
jgi:hypothetical protein